MSRIETYGPKNPNLPFHPAVRAGDFVYVSGQVAKDEHGAMVAGTIEEETRATIRALERALQAAGCELADICKVTTYLEDARDFGRYNGVFKEFFPEGRLARTTVEARAVISTKVEMDCIAYRPLLETPALETSMIRLLGRATSGNVQKVIFLLEELALPYTREDYGRQFENTGTAAYRAMNPTGKVPTIVDGELAVWESNTILRYLATKQGSELYPAEAAARSHVERWMDWGLAGLGPAYMAGFRDAKNPEGERAAETGPALAAELGILETQVAGAGWVAQDRMSLADVALGPIVRRCLAFPYSRPEMPALDGWVAKLGGRPAFQKAVAAG